MAKVDLSSQAWCDLVFSGKNKAYGAYKMRETSPRRHNIAVILVIVIALIALFAFQTYSRMKKRVDSENKQFEEMQKKERREAVEKVIRERKEQFEQEEKLKQAQAEGDIEDVAGECDVAKARVDENDKNENGKDNNADKNDSATADESEYSIYPDDYEYMRDNRTDDLTKL